MSRATFHSPDLTVFCCLDELGLVVVGQRLEPGRAALEWRVVAREEAPFRRGCGAQGAARATVMRRLAHEPLGWRPTTLATWVGRFRCAGCCRVWRHTRRGDNLVTVVAYLPPIREGTGPARLLDRVQARSKQVFRTWLTARPKPWRGAVEVVAMDGFTGSQDRHHRRAARRHGGHGPLPRRATRSTSCDSPVTPWTAADDGSSSASTATADEQATRSTARAPPPCKPAPTCSPTNKRRGWKRRSQSPSMPQAEATWVVYQPMITAYRHQDRTQGRALMSGVSDSVTRTTPGLAQLPDPHSSRRAERTHHPRADPQEKIPRHPRLLRPAHHRQGTDPGDQPLPSSTCTAPPSASATPPTTPPDHCLKPAASDLGYTPARLSRQVDDRR